MNNQEINELTVGDYFAMRFNGREYTYGPVLKAVHVVCNNPRSRAHGHSSVIVTVPFNESTGSTVFFSLSSDEYLQAEGYPVFNAEGLRIRGATSV